MYSGSGKKTEEAIRFEELRKRVLDLKPEELQCGPSRIKSLPCERPWFTAFGVALINVIDIRRGEDGKIECQLADEDCKPYDHDKAWYPIDGRNFWKEWPK